MGRNVCDILVVFWAIPSYFTTHFPSISPLGYTRGISRS